MRIEPGELQSPERVEQLRRSALMSPPDQPCLNNAEAATVLGALLDALLDARRQANR